MRARIWGYAILGLAVAGTAAIMAASASAGFKVFLTTGLIVGFYAVVREAHIRSQQITVGPNPNLSVQLPVGFGRALLEQMPAPLLVIDKRGRVSYANPAAFSMIPRLKTGEHFANLFRAPSFVAAVTDTISTGKTHRVEFATGQPQDRQFAVQVGPVPAGSDLGEDVQAIVQLEDRSDAHRLAGVRTDFIANASHELRTPLASIVGYIETLQGHARNDPEAREKFLGIMQAQAARMQRLVEDLMSLSRIEMNEHLRPEGICQPGQLAVDTVAALAPLMKQYESDLSAGAVDTSVSVRGDRDQLNQVLTNLVENALKYSGTGAKVRVFTAGADPRHPRMTGLTIEDSGPGIAREHLHRLTERFYRVNVGQSREKGGTGLGLAIVKHILNRHGGELEITSRLGQGSRFTIWLPRVADDTDCGAPKTPYLE